MLDSNTHYLNEYEYNQDILEKEWEATMQEKQDAVVELAVKLIKKDVDDELFNWVFSEYTHTDDIQFFYDDLDSLVRGDSLEWYESSELVAVALEGACKSLYDCELDEIIGDGEFISSLVDEVVGGL